MTVGATRNLLMMYFITLRELVKLGCFRFVGFVHKFIVGWGVSESKLKEG